MTDLPPPPTGLASLAGFLAPYDSLLRRSESRAALLAYVEGLGSEATTKTATEIARVVPGTSSQRLQEFLTRTNWDEAELNRRRVSQLAAHASQAGGVLVLDEVPIPKAGTHSVGASRQCRGPRGGAHNCQRVLVAHYADDAFDWPTGARLYLPREWAEDADRRQAARIPESVAYRPRAELALELLHEAQVAGVAVGSVVLGAGLGGRADLLDALDALEDGGRPYVATLASLEGLQFAGTQDADAAAPLTAAALAAELPRSEWRRLAWRDLGGKARVREYAAQLARRTNAGGEREGVHLLERRVTGDGTLRAFFGVGLEPPCLEPLARLARLGRSAARYYAGEARRLGFEDYEGRLWVGFHRHLALVHLASSYRLLRDAYL